MNSIDKKALLSSNASSNLFIHLELFFVVAIWAGTFVSTKIILTQISPTLSALYRYLIASGILLLLNYRTLEKIQRRDYGCILLISLTGVTFYYLFQHIGINYTNATDAAILISLTPVFTGLISWILFRDQLKIVTFFGLFLAFIGSIFVITDGSPLINTFDMRMWGDLLILLTSICWAIYSVYGKRLLLFYSVNTLITYSTVLGTLFLIPFCINDIINGNNYALNLVGWINLFYLGGAASVYGYLAWYRALKKLSAVTVGSYLYFRPLLTGIIAAAILNEQVGFFVIIGGFFIIGGTYLSTK